MFNESFWLNTLYYDVSIIINLIQLEKIEYHIEFMIKDVTNYFRSYQKLKNKLNSSYLNISKFINKFKLPFDWIIGLSHRIKLFMDSIENSSLKNLDLIKEDIENIYNLSNYSVFFTKDIIIILEELIKNKNKDYFKKNDSTFEENLNPNITESHIERSIKYLNISSSILSNITITKESSIHSENCSFIQILNFSYSILSTLIRCSESKFKKILPKLAISEDIKNFIIYIDQIKLKQILLNLISNAVKYTNSGSIEIEAKYSDKTLKKFIEINIKDTGIGIRRYQKNIIFNDFSKILKEKIQKINNKVGTGLGLNLSKNIANMLNIGLTHDIRYNNGTKFCIFIPIEKFIISYKEKIINNCDTDLVHKPNIKGNINFDKENFNNKINIRRSKKINIFGIIRDFKKNDYPNNSYNYERSITSKKSIIEINVEGKNENKELFNLKDINCRLDNFEKDGQNYKLSLNNRDFESDLLSIRKSQIKRSKSSNNSMSHEVNMENRNINDISLILDEISSSENKDHLQINNVVSLSSRIKSEKNKELKVIQQGS